MNPQKSVTAGGGAAAAGRVAYVVSNPDDCLDTYAFSTEPQHLVNVVASLVQVQAVGRKTRTRGNQRIIYRCVRVGGRASF